MTGTTDPPYTYVPMPLNAEGNGPETDPDKVVRVQHEVWDAQFNTVCLATDEDAARLIVAALNRFTSPEHQSAS